MWLKTIRHNNSDVNGLNVWKCVSWSSPLWYTTIYYTPLVLGNKPFPNLLFYQILLYCGIYISHVVIHNLFYYMNFRRVSATPYSNYSLLYTLLLEVFSSTIWNSLEYKLLFPVVSFCCMLSICYYISYGFYGVLFIKLSIVEYWYVYCKKVLLTVSATT